MRAKNWRQNEIILEQATLLLSFAIFAFQSLQHLLVILTPVALVTKFYCFVFSQNLIALRSIFIGLTGENAS
jgi:hypothetical protein